MSKKTLLLNYTYDVLAFIPERRAIGLLFKEKVEVVSEWDDLIRFSSGSMNVPSILRMKYTVKKNYTNLSWSRKGVLKRDNYICQYCGKHLKPANATVDHVMPKFLGGGNSYSNCVTSCFPCNNKKGNRTPETAGMKLLSKPTAPLNYIYSFGENEAWHPDWDIYTNIKR